MCLLCWVTFKSVNSVTLVLQGKYINVIGCHKKINCFQNVPHTWHSKLDNKIFSLFPYYINTYLGKNKLCMNDDILSLKSWNNTFPFLVLKGFDKHCHFINNLFTSLLVI